MKNLLAVVLLFVLPVVSAQGYVSLKTPIERKDYKDLSGYEEIAAYLDTLLMVWTSVKLDTIGQRVGGRSIVALYFTQEGMLGVNREKRPVVLIYCQQHGNEPAGKEGALLLARHMATDGTTILKHVDLILVPQVNPDGGEALERNNANDMDLNRNHVVLSEPEGQAIHDLFLTWMPEVTLDVHEYATISESWIAQGMVKDAEIMVDGVTNPNIDHEIAAMGRELFIRSIGERIEAAGYSFHRYVVGSPFEGSRMRYSTTDRNDGRQSTGIYNTLSFIQEGKRYADQVTHLERRAMSQMTGMLDLLEVVAKNAHDVIETVGRCRERAVSGQPYEWAHVQMDYFPDPAQPTVRFPVFDLLEWRHVERELEQFEPLVLPMKSVRRPLGYLFSPEEERLIELLNRHQI